MTNIGGLYKRLTNVDIFTDAYRVSGRCAVSTGGIFAELDNPNTAFLDLQAAYVSRIHDPGTIVYGYDLLSFRKSNINFLILQDRRDGVAVGTAHGRSVFTRGRPIPIFLSVPAFEIAGEVMFEGSMTPSALLVQSLGGYLMLFAATATASTHPDLSYSGDLIMVHKDRVGILGMDENRQ